MGQLAVVVNTYLVGFGLRFRARTEEITLADVFHIIQNVPSS